MQELGFQDSLSKCRFFRSSVELQSTNSKVLNLVNKNPRRVILGFRKKKKTFANIYYAGNQIRSIPRKWDMTWVTRVLEQIVAECFKNFIIVFAKLDTMSQRIQQSQQDYLRWIAIYELFRLETPSLYLAILSRRLSLKTTHVTHRLCRNEVQLLSIKISKANWLVLGCHKRSNNLNKRHYI